MPNPNIVASFDLETMDINPTGIVLSLGVVFFDITKIQPFEELVAQGCNIYFNQDQQRDAGRTVSADTLEWWQRQGDAASECLDNPNKIDCKKLFVALNQLYKKLNFQPDRKATRWFSRGYFDAVFMDSFCRSFDMDPMIKYWTWRDSRSYLDGCGIGTNNEKLEKPDGMVPHNSHHDAAFEAYMIQRLRNKTDE